MLEIPAQPEVVEVQVEEKALPVEKEAVEDKPLVTIEESEEELPTDLNQIFALKPEVFEAAPATEEEEETDES